MKTIGNKAAFAELYEWDGPGRAENYGIDSYHGDFAESLDGDASTHYRALYIEESVRNADANYASGDFTKFDDAFSGAGGTDAAVAWCYKTLYCVNTWQRVVVGPADETGSAPWAAQELIAVLTGGTIPDVVYNSKGGNTYWKTFDWAGQDDKSLQAVYTQVQADHALQPLALRAPACFAGDNECTGSSPKGSSGQMYAMVRYNALFWEGEYALIIFCLSDAGCTHKLDLSATFNRHGGNRFSMLGDMQNAVDADGDFKARETRIYSGDNFRGPRWEPGVSRNCYQGAGSDYNPDDDSGARMSLGQCFFYCAGDARCNALTIKWMSPGDVDFDGFNLDSAVLCYRKNVLKTVSCDDATGQPYSTFVMRS